MRNIPGYAKDFPFGITPTNTGGKRDRLARRRWIREQPYTLDEETLTSLETTLQRVIERNIPAHVTPPRGERYPGQVLLVNTRVFSALLEAARKGLDHEKHT